MNQISIVSSMKDHGKKMNHHISPVGLKPKYEQKYVQYLKRRYGLKRAKLFSKPISS